MFYGETTRRPCSGPPPACAIYRRALGDKYILSSPPGTTNAGHGPLAGRSPDMAPEASGMEVDCAGQSKTWAPTCLQEGRQRMATSGTTMATSVFDGFVLLRRKASLNAESAGVRRSMHPSQLGEETGFVSARRPGWDTYSPSFPLRRGKHDRAPLRRPCAGWDPAAGVFLTVGPGATKDTDIPAFAGTSVGALTSRPVAGQCPARSA